jgi:hypothetical protein
MLRSFVFSGKRGEVRRRAMLKPGWLKRQFEKVEEDVKNWPTWMRREAGLEDQHEAATETPSPRDEEHTLEKEKES